MKVKVAITVGSNEVNEAIETAIRHLYKSSHGEPAWFDSEEEARDWAGDIIYDIVDDVLEALDIVEEDEDAE